MGGAKSCCYAGKSGGAPDLQLLPDHPHVRLGRTEREVCGLQPHHANTLCCPWWAGASATLFRCADLDHVQRLSMQCWPPLALELSPDPVHAHFDSAGPVVASPGLGTTVRLALRAGAGPSNAATGATTTAPGKAVQTVVIENPPHLDAEGNEVGAACGGGLARPACCRCCVLNVLLLCADTEPCRGHHAPANRAASALTVSLRTMQHCSTGHHAGQPCWHP